MPLTFPIVTTGSRWAEMRFGNPATTISGFAHKCTGYFSQRCSRSIPSVMSASVPANEKRM